MTECVLLSKSRSHEGPAPMIGGLRRFAPYTSRPQSLTRLSVPMIVGPLLPLGGAPKTVNGVTLERFAVGLRTHRGPLPLRPCRRGTRPFRPHDEVLGWAHVAWP